MITDTDPCNPKRRLVPCLQELEQEQAQKALQDRQIPDFDSGDVLEVKLVRTGFPAT